jgi:predicted  nucleic acid-binding Zn-ribbon protein
MAKKKEITVEEKLRALYDLQLIDTRIDEIRNVRGELPLEVEDLENEVAGLNKRLEKFNEEISDHSHQIKTLKNNIEVAKETAKKYEANLKNVRNNREYNSIVKEQEYQELEIQLSEKRIKEFQAKTEQTNLAVEELQEKINGRQSHLDNKKKELNDIMAETQKEEELLLKKSEEFEKNIEKHLIEAYKRIRGNVKNGLAVVAVDRGASGGSYFTIPPQAQMEIASRMKIITDEHSGRILVDAQLADEEKEKMDKLFQAV